MVVLKREVLATPLSSKACKILLLGAGEIGKEIIIEAQRLGIETVAVDRYENAPGQQVAHRSYTVNMKDGGALKSIIAREKPDAIIPEIEAINLDVLFELEKEGLNVIPNARATHIAMHRERTREMFVKEAGVKTSKYAYAANLDELKDACEKIGYPCWTKAIQSSSGQGSFFVEGPQDVEKAFRVAVENARGSADQIIVEEHIDFDIEITELAVRHLDENGSVKTSFPKPVGHYQIDGDYHSSWQMAEVSESVEREIYQVTKKITDCLGGVGLFGCELFVGKDGEVYANEISPRPHDTGMVTMMTHAAGYSEMGLHVRAVTGLSIPTVEENGVSQVPMLKPGASHAILSPVSGWDVNFNNVHSAMNAFPESNVRFFGKPEAHVNRRMGVAIVLADTVEEAKRRAEKIAHTVEIGWAGNWTKQQETKKHLL
ncbi:MAG: phosphoribosylglycinamide formyltransferase 2 [Candidatus Diapherotrites archaeon]|nr:phosphoribosylglycinamide formyltransferase 2 [Candidatus Diapherotrites archaeon]